MNGEMIIHVTESIAHSGGCQWIRGEKACDEGQVGKAAKNGS